MPIFDYRCSACNHRFEELVTRASDTVTCTKCGAPATKLLSAFAALAAGAGTDPGSAGGSCGCYPNGGGCGGFDD